MCVGCVSIYVGLWYIRRKQSSGLFLWSPAHKPKPDKLTLDAMPRAEHFAKNHKITIQIVCGILTLHFDNETPVSMWGVFVAVLS